MWETWVRFLGWDNPLAKREGYTLQCSGLENSMDCIVHGVTKSRTRLSNFHFHNKGKKTEALRPFKLHSHSNDHPVNCSLHFAVQLLSHIQLFAIPWAAAQQASLSFTVSQSAQTHSQWVNIPSNHLIPSPLSPSTLNLSSIKVFSNASALCISWPGQSTEASASA